MKVMQCIFCDQEACSDKVQWKDVIDPTSGDAVPGLMCVQSTTSAKGGESFDVGGGNAFGGAGADEGADDDVEKVNDHMDADIGFGYNAMPFGSKAELKEAWKEYVGKVRKHLKQQGKVDMDVFKSEAQASFIWLLANFKSLDYYCLKTFDTEAGGVFEWWDEEANEKGAPKFILFKWGYKDTKY
jgi:hypothetical protein